MEVFAMIYKLRAIQTDAIRHPPLRTASAILNRLNEIAMDASLRHELRLIGFIQRMIVAQRLLLGHSRRYEG